MTKRLLHRSHRLFYLKISLTLYCIYHVETFCTSIFLAPKPRCGAIGHRGLAAVAPENTLASFEAAANAGLNWIEFDLRLTSDNILVIFHDDEVDRTTNGSGLIHESPWQYLKKLDAGSWFHPYFHRETIPLFTSILPHLLQLGLYFNIELKTPPNASAAHKERTLVARFIAVLKDRWPKGTPLPLVSSFDESLLPPIRDAFREIPLGYLTEQCDSALIERIGHMDNTSLNCDYTT